LACPVNTGRHSSCLGHDGRTCAPGKHGALATTAYRRTWLQRLLAQSRVAVPARAAVCACGHRACTPFHMRLRRFSQHLAFIMSAAAARRVGAGAHSREEDWGRPSRQRRATERLRWDLSHLPLRRTENSRPASAFRALPRNQTQKVLCTQKASCKDRFVICFWCLCGLYSAILYRTTNSKMYCSVMEHLSKASIGQGDD